MSEHAAVQERALQAIPHLCDTIDYAEVQNSLFPRAAVRFQLDPKPAQLCPQAFSIARLYQDPHTKRESGHITMLPRFSKDP